VPTTTESQRPPIDPVSLTLTWLAQQETPGSDITVEQVLAPGNNYDRYLVSYLSEGLRINAYMTVPQGAQPATGWPAVVFNHGYIPPTIYRSTERYIAYQDAFARNGYIVFRPDYRGHAFSEGEATGAYGSPGYTIDVLNALASVKADPRVDANRIGMWGHSLGGYITLRAMVVNDDIKAGVIWAGVVGDYADMLENWRRNPSVIPTTIPQSARRWRDDLVAQMGTPAENPVYWNSISANSYLNTLSGPVQLHHGTADEDVPVDFSRTLQEEIEAAGGMVEYFEYADDNHNLSNSLYVALERSVAFFDQYVKNATP
jgi:dipeptidyl aminopeptidase/acylaminoacyl peptidase